MPNFLISLTSVPKRILTSLPAVLDSLCAQTIKAEVVLCLPEIYKKWGRFNSSKLINIPNHIQVYQPKEDYGPATKQLGALEYSKNRDFDYIITIDDDVIFSNKHYLEYLTSFTRLEEDACWTIGGIRLNMWPYHNKFGLQYDYKFKSVDIVRGVSGTVYPLKHLAHSKIPFDLRFSLPEGCFNDDDAYFGAVLYNLGIPIISLPQMPGNCVIELPSSGGSAVVENTFVDRRTNESRIFRHFVRQGMIGHGVFRKSLPPSLVSSLRSHYKTFHSS